LVKKKKQKKKKQKKKKQKKKKQKKKKQKKKKAHPPLKSPLNGGIYSTIPLLGGVPFTAGRVLFIRHPEPSLFEDTRVSSFNYSKKIQNEIATSLRSSQ